MPLARASIGLWKWQTLPSTAISALARRKVSGDQLDHGGFAGAIVAHQSDHLPGSMEKLTSCSARIAPKLFRDASHIKQGHANPPKMPRQLYRADFN